MRKQLGTLALSLVLGLGFIGATAPVALADTYAPWTCTMDATYNCTDYDAPSQHNYVFTGISHNARVVVTYNVTAPLDYSGYPVIRLVISWDANPNAGTGAQVNTSTGSRPCWNGGGIAPCSGTSQPLGFTQPAGGGSHTLHIWGIRFFNGSGWTQQSTATIGIVSVKDSFNNLDVPNTTPGIFNGDCVNGFAHNPHTQYGLVGPGTTHEAVSGDAVARLLYPCVLNPGDVIGYSGFSWVLPANLGLGSSNLVQLGYGQTDCNASPCVDGLPDDGVPHFMFTLTDNAGGSTMTWATFFQGGTPTLGHQYRFSITPLTIGSINYWNYCIQDLSPQTPGIGCDNLTQQTWSVGAASWFFENQRTTDALGVRSGDAPILLSNMQYRDGATWTQQTGICSGYQSPEPYYACDTTTTTIPNDTFSAYTFAH